MAASIPAEPREFAELGAHARWSKDVDRPAATAPARAGLVAKYDALIPPEVTDPVQRASMINHAISADLIKARRRKRDAERRAARQLAAAEAKLAELAELDGGGDAA